MAVFVIRETVEFVVLRGVDGGHETRLDGFDVEKGVDGGE